MISSGTPSALRSSKVQSVFDYIMQEAYAFFCIGISHGTHYQRMKNDSITISVTLPPMGIHSYSKTLFHDVLRDRVIIG